MMKKSRCLLVLFIMITSTGCLDQDVDIGIWKVSSNKDRRLDESERYGSWEFKYTYEGRWNVSCRPPGKMTSLGLSHWTDLKRDQSTPPSPRMSVASKVFSASRLGDRIELHINHFGSAIVYMERGDDTIVYILDTENGGSDKNRLFLKSIYDRN